MSQSVEPRLCRKESILRTYPIQSQNHQYALRLTEDFPSGWAPFFINCNDSSVEGIISTPESGKRIWGVQFHPESAGGPLDTIEVSRLLHVRKALPLILVEQMFTDFVNECAAGRNGGKISAMIADEVKVGAGEAQAAVAATA